VRFEKFTKGTFVPLALICLLLAGSAAGASGSLPEIAGWSCGELRSTEFDAVSGNQGSWQERDYRTPSGVRIKATLMAGKGPGKLRVPQAGTDSSDGAYGAGSSYRVLTIEGAGAILEIHPLLGHSLAADLGDATLTVESDSYGLDSDEFLEAAGIILRTL
jgi:hypothetical protein